MVYDGWHATPKIMGIAVVLALLTAVAAGLSVSERAAAP